MLKKTTQPIQGLVYSLLLAKHESQAPASQQASSVVWGNHWS